MGSEENILSSVIKIRVKQRLQTHFGQILAATTPLAAAISKQILQEII